MVANVPEVVLPSPPASNPFDQALKWIGFGTKRNRKIIRDEDGPEAFDNFIGLSVSNIQDMASDFSKRTNAQGNIGFGMQRVKSTPDIMYWVQDESLWSHTEYLTVIYYTEEYKAVLGIYPDCATLRKIEADQADTISMATHPW